MKDTLQALLDADTHKLAIITTWIVLYIWHIRNPPGIKSSSASTAVKLIAAIDLPLIAVLFGLSGPLLHGFGPSAKEPLATGDAASLLLSFMLFLSGYMAMFLRR